MVAVGEGGGVLVKGGAFTVKDPFDKLSAMLPPLGLDATPLLMDKLEVPGEAAEPIVTF